MALGTSSFALCLLAQTLKAQLAQSRTLLEEKDRQLQAAQVECSDLKIENDRLKVRKCRTGAQRWPIYSIFYESRLSFP